MRSASTSKVMDLREAVALIPEGASVALGGNTLHRAPCAVVHELARQGKRLGEVVKTAGSYDLDLLAGLGLVERAQVAYCAFETLGLAPNWRRAVESGRLRLVEHACASVLAGLRASAQGVSFLPIAGFTDSDVPRRSGFRTVRDPYTGQEWLAVPAIRPDWAVVHAHEADPQGNARFRGPKYDDLVMVRGARQVLVTCERLVDTEVFAREPERTDIPGFLVSAVVVVPRGAWPLACPGEYDYDADFLQAYLSASRTEEGFRRFVEERILKAGAPV